MKQSWLSMLTVCAASAVVFGALPENGASWTINSGESEVVPAGSALTTLAGLTVNGELTVAASPLTVNMAAGTMASVGYGADTNGVLTVAAGGKLVVVGTTASPTSAEPSLSAGVLGGNGVVTVEAGAELVVTNATLGLGRNGSANGATTDRTQNGVGTLNVNGHVWATKVETTAWWPQVETAKYGSYVLADLHVGAIINLNEGGVFDPGYLQHNDCAVTVINCNGGTYRVRAQDSNWISVNSSPLQFRIPEGKSLILDTQTFHLRMNKATIQDDFLTISGAGGLVKKGAGYMQFCLSETANTFTGPIVVEEGYLALGRPLAEGQTVLVKSGATFYPRCGADLAKITWENPAEAITAAENQVYAVQSTLLGGVDLVGFYPYYRTDALGSPAWGWGGVVNGAVTHGVVSNEHPFEMVGAGGPLALNNTGLAHLPLRFTGVPSTFTLNGERTNTTDSVICFATNSTYTQSGDLYVTGAAGAKPKVTVSGKGTFNVANVRLGRNGLNGELLVESNATMKAVNLVLGGTGSSRELTSGKVTINDSTVETSAGVLFSEYGTNTGADLETLVNELVLGPNALLKVNGYIIRNDDPRARITFRGGTVQPMKSDSIFFRNYQNGIFEVMADGSDIALNVGGNTVGMTHNHTHLFGSGGLHLTGTTAGVFTLGGAGLNDFVVNYQGDTTVDGATLKVGMPTLDLLSSTSGIVTGQNGTLYLAENTAKVRNVTGSVNVKGPGRLEVGGDNADVAFAAPVKGATLAKTGTGTMTLPNGVEGNLDVRQGTVEVAGPVAYKSYRFKVEDVKSDVTCMQLTELVLMNGNQDVTRPYKQISWDPATDNGKLFGNGETPTQLVDGLLTTKWLDQRAGRGKSAADRDRVWIRIDYAQPIVVTSYAWFTGNDYASRDPSTWRLQGSNDDGATWVDLDVQTNVSVTGTRRVVAGSFACGNIVASDGTVTVAEGATLRVSGGRLPLGSLVNAGTVELADGASLESSGGTLDGSVTGAGSVAVVDGTTTLVGEGAYSGDTQVMGGTLNIGPSATRTTRTFDGKFLRLTIKRSNGGNGATTSGYYIQFSELQFYAEDGTVQSQGLSAQAVGLAATALPAGTFSAAASYSQGTNEDIAKVFDGKTDTKWYCGDALNGSIANWHILTMRLKDDAKPIASYNFYTANDNVRRSPSDWVLEGSHDGVTWEVLDVRYWAPHTTFTDRTKYNDASTKLKPFNNGTAFTFAAESPVAYSGRFYRFTFKGTPGNALLQLGELGLVDVAGNNVAKGLAQAAVNTAATALAAGQCSKNVNFPTNGEDVKNLFDDNIETKLCTGGYNVTASANYIITLRLADTTAPVVGYYLTTANDGLNRSPNAWTVEGSADGVNWVKLDEQTGVAQPFCLFTAMNGGELYRFASYAPASALSAASTLQVDAGVVNVNDANATIGKLRVDCALTGGTINGFRAASSGVLELVNVPAGDLYELEIPLAFTNIAAGDAVRRWQVKVNGKDYTSVRAKFADGKLVLYPGATVIFVR